MRLSWKGAGAVLPVPPLTAKCRDDAASARRARASFCRRRCNAAAFSSDAGSGMAEAEAVLEDAREALGRTLFFSL